MLRGAIGSDIAFIISVSALTDTDIGGCEKMISVSVKIRYRIQIEY